MTKTLTAAIALALLLALGGLSPAARGCPNLYKPMSGTTTQRIICTH